MNCIEHHCQGESHKSSNKPCQDCAYAESTSTWSLAIVCDGHGGERYFRSQYGAQIATEITRKAISEFVQNMADSTWSRSEGKAVFDGAPFTAYSAATATDEQMESEDNMEALTDWIMQTDEMQEAIMLFRGTDPHKGNPENGETAEALDEEQSEELSVEELLNGITPMESDPR